MFANIYFLSKGIFLIHGTKDDPFLPEWEICMPIGVSFISDKNFLSF